MKKFLALFMVVVFMLSLSACAKQASTPMENITDKDWDSILSSVKGSTVNFYGWGGDERINKWIDDYLAKNLKEQC